MSEKFDRNAEAAFPLVACNKNRVGATPADFAKTYSDIIDANPGHKDQIAGIVTSCLINDSIAEIVTSCLTNPKNDISPKMARMAKAMKARDAFEAVVNYVSDIHNEEAPASTSIIKACQGLVADTNKKKLKSFTPVN